MKIIKPGYFNMPYTDALRDKFDQRNELLIKSNTKVNIVQLGDSITEIWNIEKQYPHYKVVNSGISGDQTTYMLKRLKADVIQLKPDYLILMGGTNDVRLFLRNGGIFYNRNEDEMIKIVLSNIESIIKEAITNGIDVILLSLLPQHQPLEFNPSIIDKALSNLNNAYKELSIKYDIEFLDYYAPFMTLNRTLLDKYTYDGLHPNKTGIERMSEILIKNTTIK